MKKILIFDHLIGGHHAQYIKHVLDYILQNKGLNIKAVVCVPQEITDVLDVAFYENSGLIAFTYAPFFNLNLGGKNHSENELILLDQLWEIHKFNEVLLMVFDVYIKTLALQFKKRPYKISGIYFNTFIRRFDKNIPIIRRYASYLKIFTTNSVWLILASFKIHKFYVLSDKWAYKKFSSFYLFKSKCGFVPEPIVQYKEDDIKSFKLRKHYQIDESEKVLLITGVIAPRKNIVRILDALMLMATQQRENKIVLLIVGYLQPDVHADFSKMLRIKISELNDLHVDVRCVFDERKISDMELNACIYESDLICIPYSGYYSSSAILYQSVYWKKPVLSNNVGFQGDVVEKYQLGICTNPNSTELISSGISRFLESFRLNLENRHKFFHEYTPYTYKFAEALLT